MNDQRIINGNGSIGAGVTGKINGMDPHFCNSHNIAACNKIYLETALCFHIIFRPSPPYPNYTREQMFESTNVFWYFFKDTGGITAEM